MPKKKEKLGKVEVLAIRWTDPISGHKHRRGDVIDPAGKEYEKLAEESPGLLKYYPPDGEEKEGS